MRRERRQKKKEKNYDVLPAQAGSIKLNLYTERIPEEVLDILYSHTRYIKVIPHHAPKQTHIQQMNSSQPKQGAIQQQI